MGANYCLFLLFLSRTLFIGGKRKKEKKGLLVILSLPHSRLGGVFFLFFFSFLFFVPRRFFFSFRFGFSLSYKFGITGSWRNIMKIIKTRPPFLSLTQGRSETHVSLRMSKSPSAKDSGIDALLICRYISNVGGMMPR